MYHNQRISAATRSTFSVGAVRNVGPGSLFDKGFPYSRALRSHKSCVNSITFSSGDGRWLASAGDDRQILLWDFHQEDLQKPSHSLQGHTNNIFCTSFSSSNQYLYSGAIDEKILKYDMATATTSQNANPIAVFAYHTGCIRGISAHYTNDEIFLSASEDGTVILNDTRTSQISGKVFNMTEYTDVKYHPQTDNLFLTCDNRGNLCMRDVRMAFSSLPTNTGGVVLKYVTALHRKSVPWLCQPECSSVVFDKEGKKFAAIFLHYLPSIYAVSDAFPIATCDGRTLPDGSPIPEGERSYSNTSAIKHGSFVDVGSKGDSYFTTGSDDFRAYMWSIPDSTILQEKRRTVDFDKWKNLESPRTVGFAEGMDTPRVVPFALDTPSCRMQGHRSIVNSALFHPYLPQVITAGVERHITLHSPTATAPNISEFQRTDESVRRLPESSSENNHQFLDALLQGPRVPGLTEEQEELRTLSFFDGILRQNQNTNVFSEGNSYVLRDLDDFE